MTGPAAGPSSSRLPGRARAALGGGLSEPEDPQVGDDSRMDTPSRGSRERTPAGLVATVAILASLGATLLWVHMLVAPWRLASGLVDAQRNLKKAEKALTAGSTKLARYYTLAASAGARRAENGLDGRSPLYDLARAVPVARDALGEVPHFVAAAKYSSDAAKGRSTSRRTRYGGRTS